MPVQRDLSKYFQAIQQTAPVVHEKKNYAVENSFKPTYKNRIC